MNLKNIAKIVSTILVTLIYQSLAVHFYLETGSQLPLWFDGAPVQLVSLFSSFSMSWIFVNMVMESDEKVMEFWWTNSVRPLLYTLKLNRPPPSPCAIRERHIQVALVDFTTYTFQRNRKIVGWPPTALVGGGCLSENLVGQMLHLPTRFHSPAYLFSCLYNLFHTSIHKSR